MRWITIVAPSLSDSQSVALVLMYAAHARPEKFVVALLTSENKADITYAARIPTIKQIGSDDLSKKAVIFAIGFKILARSKIRLFPFLHR